MPYGQSLYLEKTSIGSRKVKKGTPNDHFPQARQRPQAPGPSNSRKPVCRDSLYDEPKRFNTVYYQQPHSASSRHPSHTVSQGSVNLYSRNSAYSPSATQKKSSHGSREYASSQAYDVRDQQLHTYPKGSLRESQRCETKAHNDLLDRLQDTKDEDPDLEKPALSFRVNGKRVLFSTAGPLSFSLVLETKARERGLKKVDPMYYKHFLNQVGQFIEAQTQYLYMAKDLKRARDFSHVYEARVLEAAKLRISARRTEYLNAYHTTTGSTQDRALQKWHETEIPFQRAQNAVAFMAVLRWHFNSDGYNLKDDYDVLHRGSFKDLDADGQTHATRLLEYLQLQQEYERDTDQGLDDQEELNLDSPRVLNRVGDDMERGVRDEDIREVIRHFEGELANK
ncbi:hypothetical protein LTR70_006290 [Exophiala xenobiotica]|nr:hypothetical protein LTR70_006290 [Exophiala xenobiotica]